MGVNVSGAYTAPRLDLGEAFMEHAMQMNEFIAMQVLPIFKTAKKSANFSALTREKLTQVAVTRRSAKSNYNRIDIEVKDKTYDCAEHGLEGVVDDAERNLYASDFDAEDATLQTVTRALMLQYEQDVADSVFNTTTFTGASLFTDNSANPWATATTDIVGQVVAAADKVRENTGMTANALIVGAASVPNLLKNSDIKKVHFPGVSLLTLDMIKQALPSIFGLQYLLVGGARKNNAKEGQAFSGADLWGDGHAMVARIANPGDPLSTPCLGRTFLWSEDSPNEAVVEMYREEQVRGDVIRVRHHRDALIIDKNFGHLMDIKA